MGDDDANPFIITPPPGVTPPSGAARADIPAPLDAVDAVPESFITLPPSVVDSITHRVSSPRVVPPPTSKSRDDIIFFPVQPGIPAPAAVFEEPVFEDDPEATRVSSDAVLRWRLVLPGGAGTHAVAGTLFLGRNPACTPEHPDAELLVLDDTAKTLSKTHAMLEAEGSQLWVHDLDSTNGVFVVPNGGEAEEVIPGTRTLVPANADLELGEFVIRVEHR